jgi:propionyl-CoA synthetase
MPRGYAETYRRSIDRPEEFWAEAAEAIDWEKRWDRVLDDTNPPFYRWFADGRLNTCWNAVDRHVAAGRGDQVALIWDSPVTGQIVRSPIGSCATRSRALPACWPGSGSSRATAC